MSSGVYMIMIIRDHEFKRMYWLEKTRAAMNERILSFTMNADSVSYGCVVLTIINKMLSELGWILCSETNDLV